MKRKIITINQDLCNGCGECIVGCSEGALQIINGKAQLVKEDFCDGFGDCIGHCPTGALVIEEREAVAFDEQATQEYLRKTQGEAAVEKMKMAQKHHQNSSSSCPHSSISSGGCPGSRNMQFANATTKNIKGGGEANVPSELTQWPVQLHLVHPHAPFFKNRELVIMSTCAPLASANVHSQFLRGRSVVVACPKLDDTDPYIEKLAEIFREATIPKVIVVRMEVPCCQGLCMLAKEAALLSERKDLSIEEQVITIQEGVVKTINKII